jgi:molybdopterin-guanine dinucleotide biosynthesis protein A
MPSVFRACEICILAGGQSSRMGADKSRLRLGRRTLLGHVRAAANAARLPARVIRSDVVPRCGPLGGIFSALATSRAAAILFLSCDMPFVSPGLLRTFGRRLKRRTAALFTEEGGKVGFPFLIRREALPVVERQLATGRLSLRGLAKALDARIVRVTRSRTHELFNVNTPGDLNIARERWQGRVRRS